MQQNTLFLDLFAILCYNYRTLLINGGELMLLEPNVLECMYFSSKSSTEDKRLVVNYEFDLYLDKNRKICLDKTEYPDTEGCLIFRKPGQITSGKGDYSMFVLTLDFSGKADNENHIFRPVSGEPQPPCGFIELDTIPPVFRPYHFDELRELFEKLSACSYPNAVDKRMQAQYIKEFILLVLYDAARYERREDDGGKTNSHVKTACDYISKNFKRDITVQELANHLHITKNHLIKLFKKELKQTPNQYILELRLIYARYLLLHGDESVQEIAYSSGFNTPSYFTKRFFARFGIHPNELRKNKNYVCV